jgi:hypothetical protein
LAALVASAAAAGTAARSSARAQPAPGGAEEPKAVAPSGATEEILQQARGYRAWRKFPRYEQQPVFSKGHDKAYVVAWYNDAAGPSVKAGQSYPDGSILVKENRATPDAEPSAITVMAKRGGAWHWIKATPDWKVLAAGGKPIAGQDVAAGDMVFSQ